jgi:hypothetical protein
VEVNWEPGRSEQRSLLPVAIIVAGFERLFFGLSSLAQGTFPQLQLKSILIAPFFGGGICGMRTNTMEDYRRTIFRRLPRMAM